ncbi:MAG: aminopeptidase P family protein [Alphaproteobacteria bacterium]|nr:aminopeptidase P family protein [Alphaproteobacteria bacterium]
MKSLYQERIANLRRLMEQHGAAGFIVPRADEWQGEFVAPYAERLKWISGFTGSAGAAVILTDKAALMTDSRYTLQARGQVDSDIFEVANSTEISIGQWIAGQGAGGDIGYDPRLHTPKQLEDLSDNGVALKPVPNLIDLLWEDQPAPPDSAVERFPDAVAGQSAKDKLGAIAGALQEAGLDGYIFTLPDSIAWILNIRGRDTAYVPLALSYLLVSAKEGAVQWFVGPQRVGFDIEGVQITEPARMEAALGALSGQAIGMDFKRSPDWFRLTLEQAGASVKDLKDPSIDPKAIKSLSEQEAIRQAHIEDGVALARFFAWLEGALERGEPLSEMSIADKLHEFRALSPEFVSDSFPAICGFAANGAVIHYRANEANNAAIAGDGLLLIDSGGQYHYGTTDITRTIAIGTPSAQMQKNFTRVLKGHIAVGGAVFAAGTKGREIDALARAPLQEVGLNFAHGTGHGVGCFLGVHEEAANLSPKVEAALAPGMLLSNEPGYYEEGAYGIRIENLVLVQEAGADTLGFETVSFAPIDRKLIDVEMLKPEERAWLDAYHEDVYERLQPLLDEDTARWLKAQTVPLA